MREFIVPFIDGFLAGLLYFAVTTFLGFDIASYIPIHPLASSAIVFGVLVLIIDYIIREVVRI